MSLRGLRDKLNPWSLFSDSALDRDLDAYLDWRDTDPAFESEWLRVHGELKSRGKGDSDSETEDIERTVFLRVSLLTAHHEIASYIADDFDLICRALAAGYSDPWLNGLYLSYKRDRLPDSDLTPVPGDLAEMI